MITDFDKNIPIYLQIEEMIKLAIIKEKYKIGEKLPSVREYAIMLKINPNTINRALLELEEKGLIKTQRTNGKYVTEDKETIKKSKQEYIKKLTNEFISKMKDINVSKKEILELLKEGE
jgi:DNA-binding transcriptional regulator YhcF (GntR family)